MSRQRPRPWHDPAPLEGYEPDWAGQFDTFEDWVAFATPALSRVPRRSHRAPAVCIDAKGRRCSIGGDFMTARDENAFPVRYFWSFKEAGK